MDKLPSREVAVELISDIDFQLDCFKAREKAGEIIPKKPVRILTETRAILQAYASGEGEIEHIKDNDWYGATTEDKLYQLYLVVFRLVEAVNKLNAK